MRGSSHFIYPYTKSFEDETKCVSFLIKKDEMLEKYNKFWKKVSNSYNSVNGI